LKRLIMKIAVTGSVLLSMLGSGIALAPAAQARQVDCFIPSNYRVTCVNNTPYRVYMRLNIFTTVGVRTRYFVIRTNRYTVYSSAYINRITWRWHY
jgi:hypothetical protein